MSLSPEDDPVAEYEDFLVEIPLTSDSDPLSVGDLVEPTVEVSFGSGMVLRRGLVVAIDRDPSQNLLPLFFHRRTRYGHPIPPPVRITEKNGASAGGYGNISRNQILGSDASP